MGFPGSSVVKNPPAKQEIKVQSLVGEDPLEKKLASPTRNLAWKIPWTEEPGRLQSMGSQRVGYNLVNEPTKMSRSQSPEPVTMCPHGQKGFCRRGYC